MRISDWSSDVCSSDLIRPSPPSDLRRSSAANFIGRWLGSAGACKYSIEDHDPDDDPGHDSEDRKQSQKDRAHGPPPIVRVHWTLHIHARVTAAAARRLHLGVSDESAPKEKAIGRETCRERVCQYG